MKQPVLSLEYQELLTHVEMYIGKGPSLMDLVISMVEGKVLQFSVAGYDDWDEEPLDINLRINGLGQFPFPITSSKNEWHFNADLWLVTQRTPHSAYQQRRPMREPFYGHYDPSRRSGHLFYPRDMNWNEYRGSNLAVLQNYLSLFIKN
jgi:hypothetical protein